jgi:hypothetical protein
LKRFVVVVSSEAYVKKITKVEPDLWTHITASNDPVSYWRSIQV